MIFIKDNETCLKLMIPNLGKFGIDVSQEERVNYLIFAKDRKYATSENNSNLSKTKRMKTKRYEMSTFHRLTWRDLMLKSSKIEDVEKIMADHNKNIFILLPLLLNYLHNFLKSMIKKMEEKTKRWISKLFVTTPGNASKK